MSLEIQITPFPDGLPEPPPSSVPVGWLVEAGDVDKDPAVVLHDTYLEERPLNSTNEIRILPEVSVDDKVSPTSKHIIRLDRRLDWWRWWVDLIGERNIENYVTAGDGFQDTNDDDIPLLLPPDYPTAYTPNPAKDLKQYIASTGGNLIDIERTINQSGTFYEVVKTLDFKESPVNIEGVWYYKDEPMSFETHPQYFTSRVNRNKISTITWLTRNGIIAATDGGLSGGKGDEHWPIVAEQPLAIQNKFIHRYPTLPFTCYYSDGSFVIDGELNNPGVFTEVVVDAYVFQGANTYGRIDNEWVLLEEMLVRANVEYREPGNGFDWRCYASFDGELPYMPYRAYRVPVCGWQRA